MTTPFSWSDSLHIGLSSCLPCLHTSRSSDSLNNPTANHSQTQTQTQPPPRAHPDELQGLLHDDLDAMSLHSNPGQRRKRTKKKKKKKSNGRGIRLFGFDLFGRPQPVHLPEDADDHLYHRRRRTLSTSTSTSSSTTPDPTLSSTSALFDADADAEPLNPTFLADISRPSSSSAAALLKAESARQREAEEQKAREKAERKAQRKLERRLKREMALRSGEEEEEGLSGLQGSGPGVARGSFGPGSSSGRGTSEVGSEEAFGPFVVPLPPPLYSPMPNPQPEEDDDEADLDGLTYARRAPRPQLASRDTSDSRSRTSASNSNYGLPPLSPIPPHLLPTTTSSSSSTSSSKHKKNKKSKSSGTSSRTHSHSSSLSLPTSQSPSIASPSPSSPSFPALLVSPSTIEHGQGFFDRVGDHDDDDDGVPGGFGGVVPRRSDDGGRDAGVEKFPSTGFGGRARSASHNGMGNSGAFLATR